MKKRFSSILVVIFLMQLCLFAEQKKSPEAREQRSFCEGGAPEELLLKPAPLPSEVVSALMNTTQDTKARALAENEGKHLDTALLFTGTKIRVADSADVFYLVMGAYPMSGADNTWFWVVRQSVSRAKVLLWASGNCIDISRKHNFGYRNVETTWSSASETVTMIYKYDGKQYRLSRRRSSPIF